MSLLLHDALSRMRSRSIQCSALCLIASRRRLFDRPRRCRSAARSAERAGDPRLLLFAGRTRVRSYVLAAFGIIAVTTHDPCGSGAAELPCRCPQSLPETPIIAALLLLTATAKTSRAVEVSKSSLRLVSLGNTHSLAGAAIRVLLACHSVPGADPEERDGKRTPKGITPRSGSPEQPRQLVECRVVQLWQPPCQDALLPRLTGPEDYARF